ncbi:Saccharopine dehydrogenase [NADP, L-glutamate-forming] [hydrothermal vent metagenome]|uniref:Saccharopine dehydrogenase [NADP, L-glutamate-forming] n=1 Tax=hydrothermal vent metagenome TaxID=652676 RepID=A0A3B1CBV1_9ZZZZ
MSYMLVQADKYDWQVTVADYNYDAACSKVCSHPRGEAVQFDVNDENLRNSLIQKADIVLNFLAPPFQYLIALDCLTNSKSVISASYENSRVGLLNNDAKRKGILILNEMGLDPGIDHMSAMSLIQRIRDKGGYISSFVSYGSGVPAPEVKSNPLNYCITWNPRNVVMAGDVGALYMEQEQMKLLPYEQLFHRTWNVEIEDVGTFEAYPNRDSLVYQELFKLGKVKTMVRGTLRYPGWSETWAQIVKLGIPNEYLKIPNLDKMTYREFIEMFLPLNANGNNIEPRIANFLKISPTGRIMENFKWLGLFSDEVIGGNVQTAAEVMQKILIEKMPLPKGARDMVILAHEIVAEYPTQNKREKYTSTLVDYGVPNGITAIAKTVGAPAGIAAKLILLGELKLTGTHIPTHPDIYQKVLKELEELNLKFVEKVKDIE